MDMATLADAMHASPALGGLQYVGAAIGFLILG